MITETVNAVLKAEQEANLIVTEAAEEAKRIVNDATLVADALRKDTVTVVKNERKAVVAEAEKQGQEEYEKILEAGKNVTEKLETETEIGGAAQFIKEKVLERYARS